MTDNTPEKKVSRLNVNLSGKPAADLRKMCETYGITMTEAIEWVAKIHAVVEEGLNEGATLVRVDEKTGKEVEIRLIF